MVRDRLPSFGFNRFVPSSSVPSSSSEGIADHAAETAYQPVRDEPGQHVYERLASFELVDQSKRDAACGSGCVGASHLLLLVRLMIAGMTRRKGMAGGNQTQPIHRRVVTLICSRTVARQKFDFNTRSHDKRGREK